MKASEFQKEVTEKYDAMVVEHLNEKLILLKEERILKQSINLKRIEPEYEYENDSNWIDHVRKVALINIEKEIMAIEKQKDDLKLKALEEEEQSTLEETVESTSHN